MKVAVIGSRALEIQNLCEYLPPQTCELISGGAKGVDTCVRRFAKEHGIPLTELLPQYTRYGRFAPLRRNLEILARADFVLAFWDGKSRGTAFVIEQCKKTGKAYRVVVLRPGHNDADKP